MTGQRDAVEVTAADREAASKLVVPHGRWPGFPSDFITGRADENDLTQAFARHRIAAEAAAGARVAEALPGIEAMIANVERWLATGESASPDESKALHEGMLVSRDTLRAARLAQAGED